ncbi:hypothetical protein BJ508DRAFT_347322 [Ascobolus immersus RN42]|uniref:Uncharacterized protein n=1 Tax=Ascobolus immersus RN42 TaxID=1160509 RepID=A0A3N4I2M6_ASCIM|nr:hypothetical protein BJ508DRAFT_347322 [Ascobolus immersus RN42]
MSESPPTTASNSDDDSANSQPGKPRPLPPHYAPTLFAMLQHPESIDDNYALEPSRFTPSLYPFLALCEKHDLTPYDEVLFDRRLRGFLGRSERSDVGEFMVMLYHFPKWDGEPCDGSLETPEDVDSACIMRIMVYVNKAGFLCTHTIEDQWDTGIKWEYTEECYKKALEAVLRSSLA